MERWRNGPGHGRSTTPAGPGGGLDALLGQFQQWSAPVVKADRLEDLVRLGTLTAPAARFLEASVAAGLNILVAGGTQAGKTTLLNCLAAAIPPRERVVTVEEVFELVKP